MLMLIHHCPQRSAPRLGLLSPRQVLNRHPLPPLYLLQVPQVLHYHLQRRSLSQRAPPIFINYLMAPTWAQDPDSPIHRTPA